MHAAAELFQSRTADEAAANYRKQREERLATQAALVNVRIFWDSISSVLTGRELILIDSDKIGGRLNLMLFDPEQLRFLAPAKIAPKTAPKLLPDGKGD
jgi:hypothetical protein